MFYVFVFQAGFVVPWLAWVLTMVSKLKLFVCGPLLPANEVPPGYMLLQIGAEVYTVPNHDLHPLSSCGI